MISRMPVGARCRKCSRSRVMSRITSRSVTTTTLRPMTRLRTIPPYCAVPKARESRTEGRGAGAGFVNEWQGCGRGERVRTAGQAAGRAAGGTAGQAAGGTAGQAAGRMAGRMPGRMAGRAAMSSLLPHALGRRFASASASPPPLFSLSALVQRSSTAAVGIVPALRRRESAGATRETERPRHAGHRLIVGAPRRDRREEQLRAPRRDATERERVQRSRV